MREVRLNQTVNVQAGNRLKRLHRAELGHDYVFLERDDGVELVKCHISQTKFNLPHCFSEISETDHPKPGQKSANYLHG